ncbi:hypothetical protein QJS10_CPB20g01076 [Acorus calamus]|uniref:RING/U-box superfamily protein n=1 Tax=Acorus calamus TaxID=4465 RepID=A0AAV9CBD9_ACOCL|nr:hypothetical protein QJS10_CPB20g01076 [Acorus calamus]
MGSGGSKDAAAPVPATASAVSSCASSSSSSTVSRVVRWRGAKVFRSSCLGRPSVSSLASDIEDEQESSPQDENGRTNDEICLEKTGTESFREKNKKQKKIKIPLPDQGTSGNSNIEHGGWSHEGASQSDPAESSSSSVQAALDRSSNPLSRSRSCFGFIPDRIGFRLGRTTSLGSSSGVQPFFSTNFSISNAGENSNRVDSTSRGSDANPSTDEDSTRIDAVLDEYAERSRTGYESIEPRRQGRRSGTQETLEGSIRFSRTLSVGRLRDRVLRRTSISEGLFGSMLEDGLVLYDGHGSGRQIVDGLTRNVASSYRDGEMTPISTVYGSVNEIHDYDSGILQSREARMRELREQRSAFIERRRRIRTQVRALQRLGSRFENLSGHERSCILSGQHRTGRCTCRTSNRVVNPEDGTSARASISRIVMLAEALFEVLDEIHQQSVVLSSRPSVSSIGSIPAPKEVVERMPVKMYTKPHKNQSEDSAQVCPLCRGDVCRPDLSVVEKI